MARRFHKNKEVRAQAAPASPGHISVLNFLATEDRLFALRILLIAAAIVWIYWPALHGGWLWDDNTYLAQNPLLQEPGRLWKAWFQPGSFIEYYPVEQTVQWVQWQLWGQDTLGYHLTNVGLHFLSALLVWRLLIKLGLRFGWVGGLLFAVHPMMVESVAWICELKNTLMLPFFLLAVCSWIDYAQGGQRKDYLRALAFFLLAMLCKISVAPFPVVLLLFAWWRKGRVRWDDVIASAPFFILSLILGALTAWCGTAYLQSQYQNAAVIDVGGFFFRLALAGQTLAFYFVKCFWPADLMPIYPQWNVDPTAPLQYLPWIVLAAALYWLWRRRRSWGRHALLGLGFFILMLGPFLGFVPISYMSFTWIMDHFLYVPVLGIVGVVVAGMEDIDSRLSATIHPLSTGLLIVLVALLAFKSRWYASAFTGEETLWTYTLERNPEAWLAHYNLGKVLLDNGEAEQAREHLALAVEMKPDVAQPYTNLGAALAQLNRIPEALAVFNQSLKIDPYSPETNNNLGIVLAQTGHLDAAMARFTKALEHHPRYTNTHVNLGHAFLLSGRNAEAIGQFQAAANLDPSSVSAHDNLALALDRAGRYAEAADQFRQALQLDPNDAKASQGLTRLQQELQKAPGAK